MRRLRGLLVDDRPDNSELIEQTLDLEFAALGCEVDWIPLTRTIDARRTVQNSTPFDFAIVDLYFKADEQDGLAVVGQLKKRDPRTFVLVVTSDPSKNPGFVADAKLAGATHAISRGELIASSREWSFEELANKICFHLVAKGLATGGRVSYRQDDLGIRSVLESLGGNRSDNDNLERGLCVVQNLAMSCLGKNRFSDSDLRLIYLTPGRSGAYVCRVDRSVPGNPTESFVLKLGLDRGALDEEYRANQEAGKVLGQQTLVALIGNVESDPSGYHAITAKVADNAGPLGGWLIDTATAGEAREMVSVLFGEQLGGLFRDELRQKRPILDWMTSSALLKLRVLDALARYRDVLIDPGGGGIGGVDALWAEITGYLDRGAIAVAQPERLAGEAVFVRGFGDLHSSNVLVQQGVRGRPVLVDASRYGTYHWGTDAARMLVDLFLRIRDPGVPSMLWTDLAGLTDRGLRLCPHCVDGVADDRADGGAEAAEAAGVSAVDAFTDRLVGDLPTFLRAEEMGILREVWHWQWHVALAKEFLRQGPSPDLTPPRAALSMMVGAGHLGYAARLVDELRYA